MISRPPKMGYGVPEPTRYPGLDIRDLHRGRYLRLNVEYSRLLLVDGRYRRVKFKTVEHDQMYVWSDVHVGQLVEFAWTGCHLGGRRIWFVCPECDRRCAIIYSSHEWFACRVCANFHYTTKSMNAADRAWAKAVKLRKSLGWGDNILAPMGDRPEGMHMRTFQKHQTRYMVLAMRAFSGMVPRSVFD